MTQPAPLPHRFPGRSLAGAGRRGARAALQQVDPSRLLLKPTPAHTRVGCVAVYRLRHAPHLRRALRGVPAGTAVRLWCLDAAPPALPDDLRPLTVGHGRGTRFVLLNRLLRELDEQERRDALVLLDDDVRFVVGDLDRLVGTGLRAGLDVFQPAHGARSHASWELVHRRAATVLRRTALVEQGPVLVLAPAGQRHLLPLPEDLDMGWGSEVRWARFAEQQQLTLGIVDAVVVRHLFPGGLHYDRDIQEAVLQAELVAAGLTSLEQLMRERGRTSVLDVLGRRQP